MRLRPSGRSGPVATSLAAFDDYQHNEAWTWEHMALTRARVVGGVAGARGAGRGGDPRRAVQPARRPSGRRPTSSRCAGAIAAEKGDAARWDLKYAAGGLVDLEFIAQYLQLVHAAATPDILDTATAARAREGRAARHSRGRGCRGAAAGGAALPGPRPDPAPVRRRRRSIRKSAGGQPAALLARAADVPDFATLDADLAETQARVRKSFVRILGARRDAGGRLHFGAPPPSRCRLRTNHGRGCWLVYLDPGDSPRPCQRPISRRSIPSSAAPSSTASASRADADRALLVIAGRGDGQDQDARAPGGAPHRQRRRSAADPAADVLAARRSRDDAAGRAHRTRRRRAAPAAR